MYEILDGDDTTVSHARGRVFNQDDAEIQAEHYVPPAAFRSARLERLPQFEE